MYYLHYIHASPELPSFPTRRSSDLKLTDLGLVKEVAEDYNLTRTGRGLGTPHFMAPEQFKNAKNADARCDVYSLGATLYRSEEHTSELQSPYDLVCRLLLEKKKTVI